MKGVKLVSLLPQRVIVTITITITITIELSLYEKCHHNLICGKINFNVPLPPPYIREVWDYKNAKVGNIQQSVSGID